MLREAMWTEGFSGLAKSTGKSIGEFQLCGTCQADQYGIRTFVQVDDPHQNSDRLRGRINLSGQMDERYGVRC